MELITELVNNQFILYIPVALVLVALTLLFTFGFKSAEQPPFDKLAAVGDDRKSATKKRKIKEKKGVNGNVVPVSETKSEKANNSPTKETQQYTPKLTKKQETNSPKVADKKKPEVQKIKKADTVVEEKNKKNLKKKPVDYDDGNWETVPSKNDKKKKQDSPKKEKKVKKTEKDTEKAVLKDEVDKEDNKENKATENIKKDVEIVSVIEKKPKEKQQKKKEEVKTPEPKKKVEAKAAEAKGPVVPAFDEPGDEWTDSKAAKKGKKKSRRDN